MFTFTFSPFHQLNATDMGEMKMNRGKKNYKDVGRLISIHGKTGNRY